MIRVRRANNGMKLFVPSRIAIAEGTQPMPEKKPSMLEFERRLNAIIHLPTGATWTTRPGSTEIRSFKEYATPCWEDGLIVLRPMRSNECDAGSWSDAAEGA